MSFVLATRQAAVSGDDDGEARSCKVPSTSASSVVITEALTLTMWWLLLITLQVPGAGPHYEAGAIVPAL